MKYTATVFCMICRDLADRGEPISEKCDETAATFGTREEAEAWAKHEERGYLEGDYEVEEIAVVGVPVRISA